MAYHLVKLNRHGKQYRITLPGELVERAGLVNAEILRLQWFAPNTILIEEYLGKGKEKGDLQKD